MAKSIPDELHVPWLLGFSGRELSPEFLRLCRKRPPAALILFRDNLARGPASLAPLRRRIEEAAGVSLPLFLDEEGGWIQVTGVRPSWPSPRAQALDGVETVEKVHRAMATRACHLGVEVLCAPLADLDDGGENPVIGSRSFGADAEAASRCVTAALRGLAAGGVLPVLKHFPGHGDSLEDSHFTLPKVPTDRGDALIPFDRGIQAGVAAVMTAHLQLGDDPRPATFRRDLIQDLLRGEMGFDGLVVSDALEMKATAGVPLAERGAAALAAGCDLLTLARWRPGLEAMIEGLPERAAEADVERAVANWAVFLDRLKLRPGAGPEGGSKLEEALARLREGAIFNPRGGEAAGFGVRRLALEFGPTGSRTEEDYLHELARFPLRVLRPENRLKRGEAYLYIGRTPPRKERLEEIRTRYVVTTPPVLLVTGPVGWCRRFRFCLATGDPSPPGILALVERARTGAVPGT